ncbi:ABC transporter ATP-binding protein [Bacillus sp. Bva_UNVM-123]|uniref:ABC transporter ATP-binding protein n=1 Tax=Bacillus sp. Bva_UNVM-123 TaxID=2829798 RepID=UPI00391F62EE
MDIAIQTTSLTKAFQGKEIVSNVNMTVKKGEIYGFLGPNGAGKTSIMKMLLNLVKPTAGEIEILGERLTDSSFEVLKKIGSIIEVPIFYEKMTGYENLELHSEYMGYYNKQMINETLELVGLKNINTKPVKEFSLGMKQRLAIARAILTKPELLILDEPINGLDPIGMKEMRNLFQMLNKEYGITILISSHLLSEIEHIAHTIGVISNGRLLKEVSMEQIRHETTEYIELVTPHLRKACVILENRLHIKNYKAIDDHIIRIYAANTSQARISKELIENGVDIDSINKRVASLEEYFLNLIHESSI